MEKIQRRNDLERDGGGGVRWGLGEREIDCQTKDTGGEKMKERSTSTTLPKD